MAPGQSVTRRTKVANGKALFSPEGCANGWWARRYGEILGLRLDDMGGAELLSESQISLAKRACTLEVELERRDAALSTAETAAADVPSVSLKEYAEVVGTLARVLEKLGLKRVSRQTGPRNMAEYAALLREKNGGVIP